MTLENDLIASVTSLTDDALQGTSIPRSVLALIPYQVAIEYFVLPVGIDDCGRIHVLMAYPGDSRTLQAVQIVAGRTVRPRSCAKEQLLKRIAGAYGVGDAAPALDDGHSSAEAGDQRSGHHSSAGLHHLSYNKTNSAITIVDDVLHEAIRLRASDIHLEPFEREMGIRFRVDGVLQQMMTVPAERITQIASRVKIMSGMDIAERRRAQDGRIRITEQGKDVDIRVSSLPTDFGEKIVLRLLDKSAYNFTLQSIGMDESRLALFRKAVQMPNGIVLLTGPTGSGKTTTLYSVINYLKKPGINFSTVEDPIEYNMAGVNQTQVNTATGMTFANSLRTLLRQDPDVIMVGEMRDQETAEIAVRSSLTGHLVLSTLHTNDSPAAIDRKSVV